MTAEVVPAQTVDLDRVLVWLHDHHACSEAIEWVQDNALKVGISHVLAHAPSDYLAWILDRTDTQTALWYKQALSDAYEDAYRDAHRLLKEYERAQALAQPAWDSARATATTTYELRRKKALTICDRKLREAQDLLDLAKQNARTAYLIAIERPDATDDQFLDFLSNPPYEVKARDAYYQAIDAAYSVRALATREAEAEAEADERAARPDYFLATNDADDRASLATADTYTAWRMASDLANTAYSNAEQRIAAELRQRCADGTLYCELLNVFMEWESDHVSR
jgi:hypothetical protein